ncbi:MAG: hypothetical protein ACRD2T_00785 [Thermoanaerobaculia bacterium]
MKRTTPMLLAAALAVLFLAPLLAQTVIRPSKEDRILEKLDQVLANQKELLGRLDRVQRALGAEAAPAPAGKKAP